MQAPPVSPATCRRAAGVALVALGLIAVTGAAVRLTQSGLGCPDWPSCTGHRLYAAWQYHAVIEFGNRVVTILVVVATAAALIAAWRRVPRRRDLTWLAAGTVAGVIAQAVLGGITVLAKLAPGWVMAHFLLSMVVIADAVVLYHRAGIPDGSVMRPRVPPATIRTSRALIALTAVVLGLGTVVTGAGPHSGSSGVGRLPISPRDAAELHSAVVMLLIGVALATVWMLEPTRAPRAVQSATRFLVGALIVQAVIGYTQYFTGVPPWLVELHVIGAVVIWVAVLRLRLVLSVPERLPAPASSLAGDSPERALASL